VKLKSKMSRSSVVGVLFAIAYIMTILIAPFIIIVAMILVMLA
jgi:hypothetical protein